MKSSFFVCTLVALSDYKNEKGRSKYLYDLVKTISIQLQIKEHISSDVTKPGGSNLIAIGT